MSLQGKRIAILAENDYEDLELLYPWLRLIEAGARVDVVGSGNADGYVSKHGYPIKVDVKAEAITAADYDGVVVPGGFAPDRMRRYPAMLQLVRELNAQGKVVAAICHAGWVFVSAGILKGKTVTSTPAIKDDMINAGATWVDQEVVQDGNMITSRKPGDLPAFMKAIIAYLGG